MAKLKVSEILARILHDEYLRDPQDLAKLTPEELNKITSISIEDCKRIIEQAKQIRDREKSEKAEERREEPGVDAGNLQS